MFSNKSILSYRTNRLENFETLIYSDLIIGTHWCWVIRMWSISICSNKMRIVIQTFWCVFFTVYFICKWKIRSIITKTTLDEWYRYCNYYQHVNLLILIDLFSNHMNLNIYQHLKEFILVEHLIWSYPTNMLNNSLCFTESKRRCCVKLIFLLTLFGMILNIVKITI